MLTERILTADGRQAVIVGIGINVHQRKFPCGLTGIATSIDIETARCAGLSDEERDGTPAYQTAAGNADERRNRSKERVTQNALCPVKRRSLTEAVWRRFLFYYTAFLRVQDLGFVRGVYNDRLVNNGRACRVLDPNGVYEGTALGIDEKGRLLIRERSAGTVRAVDAGEVSVRGIYGYV
ncbi:MAG: hypothetical protein IJT32_03170 [Lachnospiraceae bacterium]|nr:hypothetical protein [Lachnospiraceae bacterium]